MTKNSNKNELTIAEHLQELKKRVLTCFFCFVIIFILCYTKATDITKIFLKIGANAGFNMGYISPQEMLIQSLRICGIISLLVTLPIIAWHVLQYILPIFSSKKAKMLLGSCITISILLFVLGIWFCMKILFPFVFQYLQNYSAEFGVKGYVSVKSFLDIFLTTSWIMGFLFEVPIFSALLSKLGVLNASLMIKAMRGVIIVIAIISAIITPPDVVSMLIVGIPMTGIYVISIIISFIFGRNRKGKKNEEA